MVLQEVEIPSRRDRVLRATLHQPVDASRRAMVVCHGMLSSRFSTKHTAICERAASDGFLALRFDFAGRGDSEGTPEDLTISGEVADLGGVFDYVNKMGGREIHLVGSSLGGTVAILAAAIHANIKSLVTIAAPAIMPNQARAAWGDAAREVPAQFYDDAAIHNVVAAAGRINCPWLIIHGIDDPVVPVEQARQLAKAAPSARLLERIGAGHRFAEAEHFQWLIERVVRQG